MSRFRSRTTAELALVAVLAVAAPAPAALPWSSPYRDGELVRFTGTVAGPDGTAIADLDVELEVSTRGRLDWRTLSRVAGERRTVAARTNARGEYVLDWEWVSGYRQFEVVAFVPVRGPGGETRQELARVDVSSRVRQGSPVLAVLTVQSAKFVTALREFVAAISTDDERRVYAEAGRPDSVDRRAGPGGTESAWWYFSLGRVYRFLDGRLAEVQRFEPVRSPETGGSGG